VTLALLKLCARTGRLGSGAHRFALRAFQPDQVSAQTICRYAR
jgi:hypothetical protein